MGTVLKRQRGSRRDLYGSKVRTPCSPRAMRYDIRRAVFSRAGVGRGDDGGDGGASVLGAAFRGIVMLAPLFLLVGCKVR